MSCENFDTIARQQYLVSDIFKLFTFKPYKHRVCKLEEHAKQTLNILERYQCK